MVTSFCAVLFPRGVLDEILNLIESFFEGFPSYSFILFLFFTKKTFKILVKWSFNELLGYIIMSFTSIPVIAIDRNKPLCIFFFY